MENITESFRLHFFLLPPLPITNYKICTKMINFDTFNDEIINEIIKFTKIHSY